MADKFVVLNPVITYKPAAGGSFVSIAEYVKSFGLGLKRESIDTAGVGDVGQSTNKGTRAHSLSIEVFHSSNWSVLSALMETEFAAAGDTEFRFVGKEGTSDATNPMYWVKCKVTDLGTIGGGRNTVSVINATWPVEGYVQKSIDNGTTWTNL